MYSRVSTLAVASDHVSGKAIFSDSDTHPLHKAWLSPRFRRRLKRKLKNGWRRSVQPKPRIDRRKMDDLKTESFFFFYGGDHG